MRLQNLINSAGVRRPDSGVNKSPLQSSYVDHAGVERYGSDLQPASLFAGDDDDGQSSNR